MGLYSKPLEENATRIVRLRYLNPRILVSPVAISMQRGLHRNDLKPMEQKKEKWITAQLHITVPGLIDHRNEQ